MPNSLRNDDIFSQGSNVYNSQNYRSQTSKGKNVKKIIPEAALHQHIAILGKTGAGKTTAAKAAIVEPLLQAGKRVAIIDPTSAWWGLRSSRDGKGPGFNILILGGDHGDMALPASCGDAVARLICEQNLNVVVDTSLMTVGERTRWFIAFATTLYRLNRQPLNLVIDESHMFMPQGKVPDPQTGQMLHAGNTLASGGRSRGIRLTMITQRPQKLHKDALTSADTLVVLRVLAPQDRIAVEDWIKGCGDLKQGKEVLNSLAGLQRGEGWVWFPEGDHLERVKFPAIATFDSSATPTDGGHRQDPVAKTTIDLAAVAAILNAGTPEKETAASSEEMTVLRGKCNRLAADLAAAKALNDSIEGRLDVALKAGMEAAMKVAMDVFTNTRQATVLQKAGAVMHDKNVAAVYSQSFKQTHTEMQKISGESVKAVKLASDRLRNSLKAGKADVKPGMRKILTALAQYPQKGLSAKQIGIHANVSCTSGTFNTYIGQANREGWIEGGRGGMKITEAGLDALGDFTPLPTGGALLTYWLGALEPGAARILQAVADAYPGSISKENAGAAAQLSATSGSFNTYVGKLRRLDLVTGKPEMRASEEFFR
mgnify:CR=1 FL=1